MRRLHMGSFDLAELGKRIMQGNEICSCSYLFLLAPYQRLQYFELRGGSEHVL